MTMGFIHVPLNVVLDPYHLERSGLYIGQGRAMMSRSGMFRVTEGLAVDMSDRVFHLPSFRGMIHYLSTNYSEDFIGNR